MNHKKLDEKLKQLNKIQIYLLFLIVFFYWFRYKVSDLQPKQIVIPISIMQILLFALLITKSIYYFGIANMVIVGIAFLPFALRKPKQKFIFNKEG